MVLLVERVKYSRSVLCLTATYFEFNKIHLEVNLDEADVSASTPTFCQWQQEETDEGL